MTPAGLSHRLGGHCWSGWTSALIHTQHWDSCSEILNWDRDGKAQHLKTKVRRTLRRQTGEHDYFLRGLSGSEMKRGCSAYPKENQMDSNENCLGALFYTQTSREAKPMRNICNGLKGLSTPEEPGWCIHFLLGSKTAFRENPSPDKQPLPCSWSAMNSFFTDPGCSVTAIKLIFL